MRYKLAIVSLFLLCWTQSALAEPMHLIKANSLIGKGETVGDNKGPFIRRIGKDGQKTLKLFGSLT